MPKCSITQYGNDYAVKTPFSQAFVNRLKDMIPPEHRSFDRDSKAWIVERSYAENCLIKIIFDCFGEKMILPEFQQIEAETKYSFQLDYVGIPKEREGQTGKTALGFSKGQWRIIFSEAILREYFDGQAGKPQDDTLFSLLLVSETATAEEIKKAWKKIAFGAHPDRVPAEEKANATERFIKLKGASEILLDENKRRRYLAGLEFERASNQVSAYRSNWKREQDYFIPPLRCGFLTVTGSVQVGRLKVSQILSWSDVTNEQGLTMVTSWNRKLNAIDYQWV